MNVLKNKSKGILLCLIVSVPVWFLVKSISILEVIGAPVIAMIIGMILSILIKDKKIMQMESASLQKKYCNMQLYCLDLG